MRSISIVEYKVGQAQFFLEQIDKPDLGFFGIQCMTDAFAGACRSVTFSMQAVCSKLDGFEAWYRPRVTHLDADPIARFFNKYRRASVHIGDTVVRAGRAFTDGNGNCRIEYFFIPILEVPEVPSQDVVSVCRSHFTRLLILVYEAFETFRNQLDDRWYFTEEHFRGMGKSIVDAVEELGFPRDWIQAASGIPESERWRILRSTQTVGCQINQTFRKYLGKTIQGPDD